MPTLKPTRPVTWCAFERLTCPALSALALAAAAAIMGCSDGWTERFSRKKAPPPEKPPEKEERPSGVLADSVGAHSALAGMAGLQVRGYSLVIGLGDQGTTECPAAVREYLIEYLTKTHLLGSGGEKKPDLNPGEMIDSPDTAVVEVAGVIPAGAPKGTRFDVRVEAIAGTQTRSLEGGYLWPCELKIVDRSFRGDRMIAGRTVARAHGPIFSNPFADSADATPADPRRAMVLGGGRSNENRNVRFALSPPAYAMARRIEQRINERFGHNPKTAEAISAAAVEVRTPAAWADRPLDFVRLVSHVYIYNQPEFYDRKMNDLLAEIERPDAPLDDIALAFEGIGKVAVHKLQPLYAHSSSTVRFFAARAGLRLGDASAIPILADAANQAEHPQREAAIIELGRAEFGNAAVVLAGLLNSDNQQMRIAAYEALVDHRQPVIQTRRLASVLDPAEPSFFLDTVESTGKPLIYVRRTGTPRIAVFGSATTCRLPLFYAHPDGWVTLNAVDPVGDITLVCRTRKTKRLSDPLIVSPRVTDLIASLADLPVEDDKGKIRGVALTYSQVVSVLDALCKDDTIPARLVMQQPSLAELLGSEDRPERPEGDLSDDAPAADSAQPVSGSSAG